jgi:hypothetical protein
MYKNLDVDKMIPGNTDTIPSCASVLMAPAPGEGGLKAFYYYFFLSIQLPLHY